MYRSKKEVLSSVKEHTIVKNGKNYTTFDAFLGSDPITKKKIRIARTSFAELKKYIDDFYKKLSTGGDAAVHLDYSQSLDARNAYDLIAQHKLGLSLVDCVQMILSGKIADAKTINSDISVGEAWERFQISIEPRSDAYKRCIKSRVGAWVTSFGASRMLAEITAAEVKQDLMTRVYDPNDMKKWKTYNNILGDIKTFIHWCCSVEQGLLGTDPLLGMKKLEIGYRQPEYMKAEAVEKLFRVLESHKQERPEVLADAILSFFCGMRQIEIERVREGEEAIKISLEDNFIRVIKCKGSLRGIRPRAFKIPDQAAAWMRSFDFMNAVMKPNPSFREHLKAYAAEAKIKLPKNAGRHTFITMYEAAYHDEKALSGIAGNTEGVRSRSYNGVEIEREGKAYFKIMPITETT